MIAAGEYAQSISNRDREIGGGRMLRLERVEGRKSVHGLVSCIY